MYSAIIQYLTGKIESLNAISKVYGLGNIVSYNGEEYPSVVSNGENVHVNFDLFKSLSFILKNGNVSRTTDEHPFLANAEKVTQVYPFRLIIYSQNTENENCESLSQQIADYVSAQISGYQSQFVSQLGLDGAKITVNSKNTDKYAVWSELYSVEHRLKEQDVLISIDFEFEVSGDETCFTTAPCETSEFSFDFGRTTFCDKVDNCLGISESGAENKYLNEKGEWVTISVDSPVDSVFGRTGNVTAQSGDYTADQVTETLTKVFVTPTEKTAITHSNRSILDAITESFTTALKSAYDNAASWVTNNGTNVLNHLSDTNNPHSVTATQADALKRDGSNANSDITLDGYSINAKSFHAKGTGGTGHVGLKHQATNATAGGNETSVFAGSDGELYYKNDGNAVVQIASRTWVNAQGFITNVITALGYTPANKAGDTFTGAISATNLSGTNTGDETQSTIKTKLSAASSLQDGYLTSTDWSTFNGKQNALGFTPENVSNKSDSYTASSSTTYASTKAVVDGLAIKQNTLLYTPEDVSNKTDTMSGNTTSSTKYLSAKGIYDWVISLGYQAALTASNFGSFLNGLTGKTTPVDADEIGIVDSAASNVAKKLTWANLKATLKTYFDALYAPKHWLINTTQTTVQGTATELKACSIEIPANWFAVGSGMSVSSFASKSAQTANDNWQHAIYLNSSDSLSGAVFLGWFQPSNLQRWNGLERNGFVFTSSTNLQSISTASVNTDVAALSSTLTNYTVPNITSTMYLIIGLKHIGSSQADTITHLKTVVYRETV